MEFPTYQPEIDTVILLNLDDETLAQWLLDDAYIREIFPTILDDFMKKYVQYGERIISFLEGNKVKTITKMKYFITQDNEEELAKFAVSLMSKPEIVKMIINYLTDKNIGTYFYEWLFYKFIADRINYPNINVTKKDFVTFFSLAPKGTNWHFLSSFIEEQMNGWPLEKFIPLFESMVLAAKAVNNNDILIPLRKTWAVYGDGYAEEALGYFDKPRNEDYIILVKYIYNLLEMELPYLLDEEEV